MQPSLLCLPSVHGSNNTSLVLLMSHHFNFTCLLNVFVVFVYNEFVKYTFSCRTRTCAGAQEASAARIAKHNGGAGCAGGSPPARQGCPAAHALAFQLWRQRAHLCLWTWLMATAAIWCLALGTIKFFQWNSLIVVNYIKVWEISDFGWLFPREVRNMCTEQ